MKISELFQTLISDGMQESRAREFITIHTKNPWIWMGFQKAVDAELRESNGKHISAKAAWERMRKHCMRDTGIEYALNNNWHSLYARAWTAKQRFQNPLLFQDVFEFRELTKKAA